MNKIYNIDDLKKCIENLGIMPTDTLLIHSSMTSIGEVQGGADTVLDAFSDYLKDGLLIFPTHTWAQINETYNTYNPATEPACVGLLPNMFRRRPNVLRSLHPTHSVAALGKDACDYISGEEQSESPCPRNGCWGKLYDRKAKILFLGCSLKSNTFLHGVEEWNHTPNRIADTYQQLYIVTPNGTVSRPMYRHYHPNIDVSDHYDIMENAFLEKGIAKIGTFGDAKCYICDAVGMADLLNEFLKRKPQLFDTSEPIPEEWYK